ncbi:MAG: ZIP family metal transporter [Clostridia bacterium]|nr:ZIP family metal transporter [Clostridia bacterium]
MNAFSSLHPVTLGLAATLFTYAVTALGAALVFFFKDVRQKPLDLMMGFAAGVMIAASFWSLLAPALELSAALSQNGCLTASLGFAAGGVFTMLSSAFLSRAEALSSKGALKRSILLALAVTLHNIPEGLAVGVAFGYASISGQGDGELVSAVMLAVGIGIQNFPEGACVAIPLRQSGVSRFKSFLIGQGSGLVEPVAGVLGVLAALAVRSVLPFALSFSAGAMIAVVCSELIPDSFRDNKTLATAGVLLGFIVMMALDVSFG